MPVEQADQSEIAEEAGSEGVVHVAGPGVPPGAVSVVGGYPCPFLREPPLHQAHRSCPRPLPLAPDQAAQAPPDPAVQRLEDALGLGQPEVGDPAARGSGRGLRSCAARLRPRPCAPQRPELALEPRHARRCHRSRGAGGRSWLKPRNLRFQGAVHGALGDVDREPQSLGQEPGDATPSPVRPPAWTAHRCCSRRRSGRTRGRVSPVPCPGRPAGCWTASGDKGPPCGVPSSAPSPPRPPSTRLADSGGSAPAPACPRPCAPPAPSARRGSPGRRTSPGRCPPPSAGPPPHTRAPPAPPGGRCAPAGSRS